MSFIPGLWVPRSISLLLPVVTVYGAPSLLADEVTSASAGKTSASRHASKKNTSGTATIYSDKFNGRKTATGEKFHQGKLTAASPRTLLSSEKPATTSSKAALWIVIIGTVVRSEIGWLDGVADYFEVIADTWEEAFVDLCRFTIIQP